ncbi:hypothetical protein CISIN_1g0007251mg, partial [Citrus sinensis]
RRQRDPRHGQNDHVRIWKMDPNLGCVRNSNGDSKFKQFQISIKETKLPAHIKVTRRAT